LRVISDRSESDSSLESSKSSREWSCSFQ